MMEQRTDDTQTTTAMNAGEPRHSVVVAPPVRREIAGARFGRRGVLRGAFWTAIGGVLAAAGASLVNLLYPRSVGAFGGPVVVSPAQVPQPGEPPVRIVDAHCLLVNLAPGQGGETGDDAGTKGGLLALWWRCPHLGCTVPWDGDYVSPYDGAHRRGWFHCPCHGSTYTKAGVRIFGPAPRSMDTMEIDVGADGRITVQSGKRRNGDADNPSRAVAWSGPPPLSPAAGGAHTGGSDAIQP